MTHRFLRQALGSSLLTLAAAAAVTLTGCAGFNTALTGTDTATEGHAITGNVHGGRQPISNATVTVYAMGKNGYGSAGAALATTTTDLNGNFSFGPGSGHTYACPAANSTTVSQNLYIVANGGNPNGANGSSNLATYLMTVLQGNCTTVITTQPQIVINELTTVASMFALQQFFTPSATVSGTFGTSATNNQGLLNAIATAGNLINLPTGVPVASSTASGAVTGYTTNPVVTITPEEAKIDTMADILAACVNTNGASTTSPPSTCGTLFSSVASPAVSDTLQAAYYLALNPTSTIAGTSNITALYNLSSATSPYQPTLTAAPSDWTLGITYGSNASQTVGGNPVYLITKPEFIAIDGTGNVWMTNYAGSLALGTPGPSLTELSNKGVPLTQAFTTGQLNSPFSLAIDPSNNVFVGNFGVKATGYGSTVSEYTAAGGTNTLATGIAPTGITIDGAGDIYVLTSSATGTANNGSGDLEAFPPNPTSSSTRTTLTTGVVAGGFSDIAVDANGTLWEGVGTSGKGTAQFLCTAGTSTTAPSCAQTAVTGGGQTASEPLVIDGLNNVFTVSYSAGPLVEIAANATNANFTYPLSVTTATDPGLASIQKITVDGAGNLWTTSTASTTTGSVSELTNGGTLISPKSTSGFLHTYSSPDKIAIDASGNVWIGNAGAAAAASATTNGFITEIVGQAVPVITPIAAGLPVVAGNPSKLGTRP